MKANLIGAYIQRRNAKGYKRGRPGLDPEIKSLVVKLSTADPLWGAPRIHG